MTAESRDINKLVSLLKEYTSELDKDCQRQLDRQSRVLSFDRFLLTSFPLAAVLIIVALSQEVIVAGDAKGTLITLPAVLFSVFLIGRFVLNPARYREIYRYHADQVARTLRELVSMASQYSEHATKRVSDDLEIRLRLAEAESVLRKYQELFGDNGDNDRGGSNRVPLKPLPSRSHESEKGVEAIHGPHARI